MNTPVDFYRPGNGTSLYVTYMVLQESAISESSFPQ